MASPTATQSGAESQEEHTPQGILGALARVIGLFLIMTIWSVAMAISYAYRGDAGLLGWIRLPEGLAPFDGLGLEMADIVAYAALFAAILLAATVQLNSTVSSADSVADQRPTNAAEARAQQRDLQTYANQAEMAMLVSFGSAFAVLLITTLFGFSEIATAADSGDVDMRGVGWVGFAEAVPGLLHPRIAFMYLVSFLLFLMTYSSMPEWKNTGLFKRQVEDNAWQSRERLALIASEHDLSNVDAIHSSRGFRLAALAGYALYVSLFALALNLSLTLFAGDEGFEGLFSAGHFPLFFLFALIAVMISIGVGAIMLRLFHLHGRSSALSVMSLILIFVATFYVMWAEGIGWAFGLAVIMAIYVVLWVSLYRRGINVLDEKNPSMWEVFLNPPKYVVVHRYEAIRRSAAILEERLVVGSPDA